MTVLYDDVINVAGLSPGDPIQFRTHTIRENDTSDGIVTTDGYTVWPDATGAIETEDLDPGPATVIISGLIYNIIIPPSSTPVRLWPLIDAGMPAPAPDVEGFVRNGGGVRRIVAVTQAEYDAIPTPDPATFYVIIDGTF